MRIKAVLLCLSLSACSLPDKNVMTQSKMERIISERVALSEQKQGFLRFKYQNREMMLISDSYHDRMRIIAPIIDYAQVTTEQKERIITANFHSALDARYAVADGKLYAAYIHPLSPLQKRQLTGALDQVASLAHTFGSSYSSESLSFKADINSSRSQPDKAISSDTKPI